MLVEVSVGGPDIVGKKRRSLAGPVVQVGRVGFLADAIEVICKSGVAVFAIDVAGGPQGERVHGGQQVGGTLGINRLIQVALQALLPGCP